MALQPNLPPADVSTPPPEKSEWRVGTLTYSPRGLVRLFSLLLWGDFAWAVRDRSVGPVFQLLLKQFQASDTVVGLLSGTFPAVINLLLGPVISYRSDRFRSLRGRRIPFLLYSAPVAAVAMFGLGFSPMFGRWLHTWLGANSPGLFPSTLIILAIWWLVFDIATTTTNAVYYALINDTVPHGVIGRFFGLFRAVTLVVGIAFNYWLLAKAEQHTAWMFAAVGLIYGVGVVGMCFGMREGEYPPPPPPEKGNGVTRFTSAVRGYFRDCFTKPYFLWLFLAVNLGTACTMPVNYYTVFFAKSVGIGTDQFGKYLAYTFAVSMCISYPLGLLADRFHPLRVTMVATVLYGLMGLIMGALATTKSGFAVAFLAHNVLSGVYYTASASLTQRLLPKEGYAQLASASGLIGAIILIVLPAATGWFLDHSGHQYRYTFYIAGVISVLAFACQLVVYRGWKRHGGPLNFVPPS